jgi:hypothetical protein
MQGGIMLSNKAHSISVAQANHINSLFALGGISIAGYAILNTVQAFEPNPQLGRYLPLALDFTFFDLTLAGLLFEIARKGPRKPERIAAFAGMTLGGIIDCYKAANPAFAEKYPASNMIASSIGLAGMGLLKQHHPFQVNWQEPLGRIKDMIAFGTIAGALAAFIIASLSLKYANLAAYVPAIIPGVFISVIASDIVRIQLDKQSKAISPQRANLLCAAAMIAMGIVASAYGFMSKADTSAALIASGAALFVNVEVNWMQAVIKFITAKPAPDSVKAPLLDSTTSQTSSGWRLWCGKSNASNEPSVTSERSSATDPQMMAV